MLLGTGRVAERVSSPDGRGCFVGLVAREVVAGASVASATAFEQLVAAVLVVVLVASVPAAAFAIGASAPAAFDFAAAGPELVPSLVAASPAGVVPAADFALVAELASAFVALASSGHSALSD